jgi:TonB family protein
VSDTPRPGRRPTPTPRFGTRQRAAARREPPAPSPRAVVPRSRLAPSAPPRRRGAAPWLVGSALLHAALLALLLFRPDWLTRRPDELPPPAFDIVFEGGQPERPDAEPPPGIELPPAPAAAASAPPPAAPPSVAAPPVAPPSAAPAPPPAAPPPPVPLPVPPAATPAPPLLAAPPAPPRPEAPRPPVTQDLPPPPLPPVAALPPPPPPAPPQPAPPQATAAQPAPPQPPRPPAPQPPVPQQPAPQTAQPRPAPRQQQAAPALPPGTLFLPDGLQFGRPAQPSPPSGRPQGRGLDLTVDPRFAEGRATADPSLNVTGAQVGADWRAAFRRWLDQNISYPRRAIELGESGSVRVRVIAEPDGRVRSVRLAMPSGSPSLNFGTTFPFEGARLPAFPPPADPNGVTIDLTVNYRLIQR